MAYGEDDTSGNEACRRLIAAAAEVFARHGFSGARVRQIADAARVNLAAVNYYFGGKEGLYRATLRHLAAQAEAQACTASPTIEEGLQRRVRELLDRVNGERPALGRILAHEAMSPTGNLESVAAAAGHADLGQLHDLLCEISRLRRASGGGK